MIVYFCYDMQSADYYEPIKQAIENVGGTWWAINNQFDKRLLNDLYRFEVFRKITKYSIPTKRKNEIFDEYCRNLPNVENLVLVFTLAWADFLLNGFVEHIKKKCYLRKQNVKTVLYLQDVSAHYGKSLDVIYFKKIFDHIITFDPGDAEKFGFKIYDGRPYSKLMIEEQGTRNKELSDVFFCGYAKNRLEEILDMYERLTAQGLRCDFYICGVDKEKQRFSDNIVYNKYLSYRENLTHVMNTRCLLEVIQKHSSGYTLRTVEAILYRKKLISNNQNLESAVFFHENNILYTKQNEVYNFKDFIENPYVETDGIGIYGEFVR